jgi:two-component system alkaline phosphatase synthesis response regulator PhoP
VSRVLVIEDNVDLAFGLRNNLEIEGHEVEIAGNGPAGLEQARRKKPDLLILDLMLPGLDGFRLLKALRQEGLAMPVLVLTARGEEADKVQGLKLGADDYVTKPFGVLELLARVEALLRRGRARPGGTLGAEPQSFGDVTVEPATRTVTRGGGAVELAPKEFDLLLALIARDGAVATRLELMREVWGYDDAVITRTIDTHVAELRRKLESDPAAPRHILTVRKIGYRLRR